MSNHLISEVYKRQVGNIARKAVMALFADKASDDGSGIWASKQRMAEEIGASKQTVISTIKGLIGEGLVKETGKRKSPNGFTVEYCINVRALRALPLVKSHADDQSENLTGQGALPVKELNPTGQGDLPDQSENLTQTLLNPPKPSDVDIARASKADPFPKPTWIDTQVWDDFLKNRQRKKLPNTLTAYKGFIEDIYRHADDDWPPGRVLTHAAMKGWGGIYDPRQSETNGKPNKNIRTSSAGGDGRSSLARAIDEGLEFLGNGAQAQVS